MYVCEWRMYVCERTMYVCERRIYVCEGQNELCPVRPLILFCKRVFFIHLYACFYHTNVCVFFHTFVCMFFFIHLYSCFFSYICMRVCMRVFFIHLYVCVWGGRGSVVSEVIKKPEGWWFSPHSLLKKRIGGLTAGGVAVHLLVIHLYAFFFSYICMPVFVIHFYACFFHTFVYMFFSYKCMFVFGAAMAQW